MCGAIYILICLLDDTLYLLQGELQQEVLEHVSVEGHRALAHFRKGHPLIPGMTLKVHRSLMAIICFLSDLQTCMVESKKVVL